MAVSIYNNLMSLNAQRHITSTNNLLGKSLERLKGAFKSTLEELEESDLLIHLVDISNNQYKKQISAVNQILEELKLNDKPKVLVFNKIDLVNIEKIDEIRKELPDAIFISALNRKSFEELLGKINHILFMEGKNVGIPVRDYFKKI